MCLKKIFDYEQNFVLLLMKTGIRRFMIEVSLSCEQYPLTTLNAFLSMLDDNSGLL